MRVWKIKGFKKKTEIKSMVIAFLGIVIYFRLNYMELTSKTIFLNGQMSSFVKKRNFQNTVFVFPKQEEASWHFDPEIFATVRLTFIFTISISISSLTTLHFLLVIDSLFIYFSYIFFYSLRYYFHLNLNCVVYLVFTPYFIFIFFPCYYYCILTIVCFIWFH